MMKKKLIPILILIFIFSSSILVNASNINTDFFVTDKADVLSGSQERDIENILSNLEKQTTIEMGVYIISSLEQSSLEESATDTFRSLGLGKKDKDNGLLIFISIEDRKIRVENGYGMEGIITDVHSKRILETMEGDFKEANYYEGIKKAIYTAVHYINESDEYSISGDLADKAIDPEEGSIITNIIFIILAIIFLFTMRRRGLAGLFFGGFWGGPRGGGFGGGGGGFGGGSSGGGGASGGW